MTQPALRVRQRRKRARLSFRQQTVPLQSSVPLTITDDCSRVTNLQVESLKILVECLTEWLTLALFSQLAVSMPFANLDIQTITLQCARHSLPSSASQTVLLYGYSRITSDSESESFAVRETPELLLIEQLY